MTIQTLSAWLRCPSCFASPLEPVSPLQLRCPNGHSFDVNKRGYLTALGPASSRLRGDDAPMLDARSLVHGSGFFDRLKHQLATTLEQWAAASGPAVGIAAADGPAVAQPAAPGVRLLDAGCGAGHYTVAALQALPSGSRALAMDLSPAAVARTVRAHAGIDGLVADTWQPLPIVDGVVDVVLDVFAPRNASEFRRVLRPGGLLLVVVPRPDHLHELRREGRLLDIPEGKAATLVDELGPHFRLLEGRHVSQRMPIDGDDAALTSAIIAMGPSAHHRPADGDAPAHQLQAPDTLTLSVDVLTFAAA